MCDSSSYSSSSSSVRLRLSLVSSAILTDQRGMETRRWDVCKQTGRWSTVLTREVRPPTYRHVGSRHDVMSVAIDWLERKGLLSRLAARTICIRQCSMPSNVMICPGSFSWIFSGNSSCPKSGPTSTITNNQHGCLVHGCWLPRTLLSYIHTTRQMIVCQDSYRAQFTKDIFCMVKTVIEINNSYIFHGT